MPDKGQLLLCQTLEWNQSISQSKPRRRWGTLTDASTVMAAHWRLSSAMRSNVALDWPVHALTLPFHDLRGLPLWRLPSMVPCSMIFGSISWQHTWPNHDTLRRLTAEAPKVWLGFWPAAKRSRSFYALSVWYAKHPSVEYEIEMDSGRVFGNKLCGKNPTQQSCLEALLWQLVTRGHTKFLLLSST